MVKEEVVAKGRGRSDGKGRGGAQRGGRGGSRGKLLCKHTFAKLFDKKSNKNHMQV